MVTQRAYQFRFYPTPQQKRQLTIEFGHARFVWNWALETRTKEHGERLHTISLSRQMLRNRRLSRAIADCGLYELRRQIEYKAAWTGRDVLIVDRWAPTSKTCSACGTVIEAMPLKVRRWVCECGASHDRDINAAINVLKFGTAGSADETYPSAWSAGQDSKGRGLITARGPRGNANSLG